MLGEWKYNTMELGGLCVIDHGASPMPLQLAGKKSKYHKSVAIDRYNSLLSGSQVLKAMYVTDSMHTLDQHRVQCPFG